MAGRQEGENNLLHNGTLGGGVANDAEGVRIRDSSKTVRVDACEVVTGHESGRTFNGAAAKDLDNATAILSTRCQGVQLNACSEKHHT